MLEPLFSAAQLESSGFTKSGAFAELRAVPIGLVDIGARWGVSEVFTPAAPIFDVLAFEPDPDEAARLRDSASRNAPWASLAIEPTAVADSRKKVTLHLLTRANNSSIFPVNQHYYQRYNMKGFELVKKLQLEAQSLDEAIFAPRYTNRRFGEVIKMDAQGAELEILRGSERTLRERTLCVVCEAAFFTPYEGACLFSDVERHLRDRGMSFYGFLDFQHRSTKRLDKRLQRGRERFMQADAVFFRDPLDEPEGSDALSRRKTGVLFVAALLFGFYDFAAELAELRIWPTEERRYLEEAVRRLATVRAIDALAPLEALRRIRASDAASSLVEMGRWVDRLRDFQTYHDVPDKS
jgi:FkbM family methyltransferase